MLQANYCLKRECIFCLFKKNKLHKWWYWEFDRFPTAKWKCRKEIKEKRKQMKLRPLKTLYKALENVFL